jgi:hypothetical protein
MSLSGGRISTSIGSLPGPVASVVFGATSAGTDAPATLRARRLLVPPPLVRAAFRVGAVLRGGAALRAALLRAGALRPAALRAGAFREAALRAGAFRPAALARLPLDFLAPPFRAALRAVPLRAAAFFAPPRFCADLPLDFRAFATS